MNATMDDFFLLADEAPETPLSRAQKLSRWNRSRGGHGTRHHFDDLQPESYRPTFTSLNRHGVLPKPFGFSTPRGYPSPTTASC